MISPLSSRRSASRLRASLHFKHLQRELKLQVLLLQPLGDVDINSEAARPVQINRDDDRHEVLLLQVGVVGKLLGEVDDDRFGQRLGATLFHYGHGDVDVGQALLGEGQLDEQQLNVVI